MHFRVEEEKQRDRLDHKMNIYTHWSGMMMGRRRRWMVLLIPF